MYKLTNAQARRFVLSKHGLIGPHTFNGKEGALAFVRNAGCIQFDPVDVCGKNAELTLQSRVGGFTKQTLSELLYEDRALFDYPDKCLSIIPTEDWPCFERYRAAARKNLEAYPEMKELTERTRSFIESNGPVSSDGLKLGYEGRMNWFSAIHWSGGGKAERAALEQMYTTGELVIHHKAGTRKFYDLAERHIPAEILGAPDPHPNDFDHIKWRVLRRIGAVGLMWDGLSDAWLNIMEFDNATRSAAIESLLSEKKLVSLSVEGIRRPLYARTEDAGQVEYAIDGPDFPSRCEFIAPLDCLMWDRKLIKALFGFKYAWEIYTPPAKRMYGHYTLPVLYGDRFIARADISANRKDKALEVKKIWFEEGGGRTKAQDKIIKKRLELFAEFNGCVEVRYVE